MDNIIKKDTVYNIFNAPKGNSSPHGEEIYEWEYLDENGKLQKDSKNVKEEINSFVSLVDYKAQIARGELENGTGLDMVSKDFTTLPDNTVDYYKLLSSLATLPQEQVTKLMESVNQGVKNNVQKEQTANQTSTSRTETNNELNGNQSKDSSSSAVTNQQGGTK